MLRVISSKRKRVPFNVQRVFVGPGPSRSRISIHIVQYMCVLKGCSTEETVVENWNTRPHGRSRPSVAQLRARTIYGSPRRQLSHAKGEKIKPQTRERFCEALRKAVTLNYIIIQGMEKIVDYTL